MRTVLAAMALIGVVGAAKGVAPLHSAVAGKTVSVASAQERHPEIRAAMRSLEKAKEHLRVAAHDFGGHRVEAIAAIDASLAQLNTCLQYDR